MSAGFIAGVPSAHSRGVETILREYHQANRMPTT